MPVPLMPAIKGAGIIAKEILGASRQVGFRRAKVEMEMIRHQRDRVNFPCESVNRPLHQPKEFLPIRIVAVNNLPVDTATRDVIERSRILDPVATREVIAAVHPQIVEPKRTPYNRLTPS